MKKIFLAFGIAASLVACKKEEAQEFTPSSANVATTSVTGYVKQSGTSSEYAVGAPITLKINKSDLYNNSAPGFDVYTTTTDENGKYLFEDVKVSAKNNATTEGELTFGAYTFVDELNNQNTSTYDFGSFTQTVVLEAGVPENVITKTYSLTQEVDAYVGNVTVNAQLSYYNTRNYNVDTRQWDGWSNEVAFGNELTLRYYDKVSSTWKTTVATGDTEGKFAFEVPVGDAGLSLGEEDYKAEIIVEGFTFNRIVNFIGEDSEGNEETKATVNDLVNIYKTTWEIENSYTLYAGDRALDILSFEFSGEPLSINDFEYDIDDSASEDYINNLPGLGVTVDRAL